MIPPRDVDLICVSPKGDAQLTYCAATNLRSSFRNEKSISPPSSVCQSPTISCSPWTELSQPEYTVGDRLVP